ncbi:hypothetical protein C8F04DRAFT_971903 [Mycena alexandri]|uniref:Uncharacterized protein n=1 Tax=Mycena alexandri TaxID=1745969 RepID=A0AAD6S8G9_9AGAR|nr:hypothetical protein C8F04DRAFT_971903 [Mycena alexandri]
MQIDLIVLRTSLHRRIARFRVLQQTYTPAALQALGEMTIPEDAPIETIPLLLPSAFTVAQHATCRAGLAEMEEELRDAQCREALVRLRNQLHIKSRFLVHKGLHSRNQGPNTRARTLVTRNETKIRLHSEKYQMSWEALRRLSVDGDPASVGWEVLKAADVRCMEDEENLERKAQRMEREKGRRLKRKRELMEHGMLPAEAEEDDGDAMDVDSGPAERVSENRRQVSWIWTVTGVAGRDADLEDGECYDVFPSLIPKLTSVLKLYELNGRKRTPEQTDGARKSRSSASSMSGFLRRSIMRRRDGRNELRVW